MMQHARRSAVIVAIGIAAIGTALAGPAAAQRASSVADQDSEAPTAPPYQSTPSSVLERQRGSVVTSAAGEAGRRQTREQEIGGIKPIGRINSRIANRVQSRLRTRIDRYYDPQANAASPFKAASEEARTAGRPR